MVHKRKREGKMKKVLMQLGMLALLALMLALTSCAENTKAKSVPCEALKEIYYENIEPLQAEIDVLLNNTVIDEACN